MRKRTAFPKFFHIAIMTQVLGSINLDGITDLQASTKVGDRENPTQEEFVLTNPPLG